MPKREKPFHLDMPFDEALRRYAQTAPHELEKIQKKRRPKLKRNVAQPSAPGPQNNAR